MNFNSLKYLPRLGYAKRAHLMNPMGRKLLYSNFNMYNNIIRFSILLSSRSNWR